MCWTGKSSSGNVSAGPLAIAPQRREMDCLRDVIPSTAITRNQSWLCSSDKPRTRQRKLKLRIKFRRQSTMGQKCTTNIEALLKRQKPLRKVEGIAAALLPYQPDGRVAVEPFQRHLNDTQRAGLVNAVNMDTSYVNYLSVEEQQSVLLWTREALGRSIP